MVIDHIGIVVKNMQQGIIQWEQCFGYKQMTQEVINTRQKVKVIFMEKENSVTIKLLEPIDESSPIYAFTKRGGGLHHLCFKTDHMEIEIPLLQENGLRLISPPTPGEAFDNENIAFLLAQNNLNVELIDTDKKMIPIQQR
jgi:methylmalonyl-CoA/ethylmalonyl-CoA epimerase